MVFKKVNWNSIEQIQALSLRYEVLRKPLNLVFDKDELYKDKYDIHFVALDKDLVVATLQLQKLDNDTVKMRQVAVDTKYQGTGIGKKLVIFCEDWCHQNHIQRIVLHARKTAVPFYLQLAYQKKEEEFFEVGIPHFYMQKNL